MQKAKHSKDAESPLVKRGDSGSWLLAGSGNLRQGGWSERGVSGAGGGLHLPIASFQFVEQSGYLRRDILGSNQNPYNARLTFQGLLEKSRERGRLYMVSPGMETKKLVRSFKKN